MAHDTLHSRLDSVSGRWAPLADPAQALRTIVSFGRERVVSAVVQRYDERKRVGELRSMSDRSLKDIGLHRSEATSVVCGHRDHRKERRHV